MDPSAISNLTPEQAAHLEARLAVVREEIRAEATDIAAAAASSVQLPDLTDLGDVAHGALATAETALAAATAAQAAVAAVPTPAAQTLEAFRVLARVLSVRALLLLALAGTFVLSLMAMQQGTPLSLALVVAFSMLTVGPLAALEWRGRQRTTIAPQDA